MGLTRCDKKKVNATGLGKKRVWSTPYGNEKGKKTQLTLRYVDKRLWKQGARFVLHKGKVLTLTTHRPRER